MVENHPINVVKEVIKILHERRAGVANVENNT